MTARFTQRLGAAAGVVYAILLVAAGAVGGPTTQPAFAMEVLAFTLFLFFLGSLPARCAWPRAVVERCQPPPSEQA